MGTDAQKREFLPALARGEKLAAFCLSEPEVGSDAANVQTHAKLSDDGSHWIINGEKKFATNAAIAGVMTVMAKTTVTENGKTRDKVTAFIVTPDLPGFEIVSPNRSKCGIRGTWQGTLRFNNMRVPRDRVLGEVGKGLKVALSVLDYGRCTLSAGCVGGAKKALELAVERARTRIAAFQADSRRVARHALKVNLMFSLLDKQRMPLAELPDYLERVGIYREFNALFFGLSPARLAELLVDELVKSTAAKIDAGHLVPAFGEAG